MTSPATQLNETGVISVSFLSVWPVSNSSATVFHEFLQYLGNMKFLLHADGMIVYLECPTKQLKNSKWIQ